MDTPICDFVQKYANSHSVRLHMPGHKGKAFLGCEAGDITEITGADALYEADGIIAQSEANAGRLFATAGTFYSTEGSSQCIRAMLYLALLHKKTAKPVILASRNAHKSLIYACALLGIDIVWLWDDDENFCLCRCRITSKSLTAALQDNDPIAVFVTSPDYLGGMADIKTLAATTHSFGVPLLVDNAHGAYLHFLADPLHPIDLGADICCDSAHKTLPVLTGGAYLHISPAAPQFCADAKNALALFGSTSPSYLILQSLDLANRYLAEDYPNKLAACITRLDGLKARLKQNGWQVEASDPLKLTLASSGSVAAQLLRRNAIECEYQDPDFTVMMFTPQNDPGDFDLVAKALGFNNTVAARPRLKPINPKTACSIRRAVLSPAQMIKTEEALNRIMASPTVGCPPAVPVAVSGETISQDMIDVMLYYGIKTVNVLRDQTAK